MVCEVTMRKTPEKNDVAERIIRSIAERARCFLIDGDFRKQLWAEAVKTSAYCINLLPAKAKNGVSPYQIWFGVEPSVQHLRVFGCRAFVYINADERKKLESRA